MKVAALILVASISTATQAQSITHIARYPSETVALSNMPCPTSQWRKVAIHNAYSPERGTSYGCWARNGDSVTIDWYKIGSSKRPPGSVPFRDFVKADD